MECTNCKKGLLVPAHLDDLFPCHSCNSCGGNWIYLGDYLRWLAANRNPAFTRRQDAEIAVEDSQQALLCPKTGHIMLKYRISTNTGHRLDLSPSINGIWLDKGEWELLKTEGLAGKLNAIFTDPWQRNIRSIEAAETLAAAYATSFGEEDYADIKEIRGWLYSKDKRAELLAYLIAEDPYSASR